MGDNSHSASVLFCFFNDGVLCCYRKSVRFNPMERCWRCKVFGNWEREMDELDEKVMDAIDMEREELDLERFERETLKYRR